MRNGYETTTGDQYLHVAIAERALGRMLPRGAVVHHVDGDKLNNAPSNLVICPSQAYHMLLHARTRVVEAGGRPDADRICGMCSELLPLTAFSTRRGKPANECRGCTNARRRGKGYNAWTPARAESQRQYRARTACQAC